MEANPSESTDEARVEQDSLLIPMEGIQQATISSSVTNSTQPELYSTADARAVKKPFLLAISAHKERMAWIVEISEPNQSKQYYLRIQDITYSDTGPVLSQGVLDENITKYMQHLDEFTYSFLSLSANGNRVAISFCKFDSKGNLTLKRPTCCTFRVNKSAVKPDKEIKCQGAAVFTSDDYLAIVGKDTVNLYDCKEDYRFASSLDIKHLVPLYDQCVTTMQSGAYQVFWSSSFSGRTAVPDIVTEKILSLLQVILHLTRFVECNLLTPCFHMFAVNARFYSYEGICVWSLTDGFNSIPFKAEASQEVLAISEDKTLLATFGRESPYLNVHHIKSGLLVSRLESTRNLLARQHFQPKSNEKKWISYVQFSKDNEYVFLVSIQGHINKENPNEALFMVEAWSRNTEKLIYLQEDRINVDWDSRNALEPYIIESADVPPDFMLVYTSIAVDACGFRLRSANLRLFGAPTNSDWRMEQCIDEATDSVRFMEIVCAMTPKSNHADGIRYQLRFSQFGVELWRLCNSNGQDSEDLIYIRTFHAPQNHRVDKYDDSWNLDQYDDILDCEDVDSLPAYGIVFMGDTVSVRIGLEDWSDLQFVDHLYLPFNDLKIAETSCLGKSFEGMCSDNHYSESVCRGLQFLDEMGYEDGMGVEELDVAFQQTKKLLALSIKKMKQEKSRYFTTISGSNTLAMLASFQTGRDIIFQILQTDDLPINILTYVRNSAPTDKDNESISRKENALTILIERSDYELFGLLFNRALLFAPDLGVGALCAITDTLIFLQERSETVILRNSCEKLKFLMMETNLSAWNFRGAMDLDVLHNSMNAEFSDFPSYGLKEQIPKHNITIRNVKALHWLQQHAINTKEAIYKQLKIKALYDFYSRYWSKPKARTKLLSLCVVPFIHFSSYTIFWEDLEFESDHSNRDDKTWTAKLNAKFHKLLHLTSPKETVVRKAESDLIQLASNQHENDIFHQKGSVIEVLLYYKWKTFIRRRFYLVCLIHLVYYLSFVFGVLFARECFAYTPGTSLLASTGHVALIAIMFTMNLILSVQELLQFLKLGFWRYIKSIYNIIDMAALIMPPVCFWLMITGISSLDEVSAITTIILWIHGILRLRPFAFIGVTLETMIQLMKSVYKTLFIMLLVIFAFTHAFIVLLLHKDDSYFQEQFSGSMDINGSDQAVSYSDTSASNSFTNVFKAFSTLWLFIYGVWDPITDGDAGDDFMIIVFAMMFSFVTVLLFFNLVIALMSSKAEEVKALGKSIWLSHFAEVIAEIEQFWCIRSERVDRNNSPSVVYYIAKYADVRQQAELLEQECDELIKELQIKLEKRQRAGRSTWLWRETIF